HIYDSVTLASAGPAGAGMFRSNAVVAYGSLFELRGIHARDRCGLAVLLGSFNWSFRSNFVSATLWREAAQFGRYRPYVKPRLPGWWWTLGASGNLGSMKKKPNKAPEPTTMAVTPRATS